MKPLEAMITGCVVFFALLLAASIYSGARGSMKIEHPVKGLVLTAILRKMKSCWPRICENSAGTCGAAPVKFGLHGNATRFVRTGLILSPSAA